MKKIFCIGIVALAISLGFTACGQKGGTLKITNDLNAAYTLRILFDNNEVTFNDGQTSIQPSQTVTVHSDEDTSYVVYSGLNRLWDGRLEGGATVVYKFSDIK